MNDLLKTFFIKEQNREKMQRFLETLSTEEEIQKCALYDILCGSDFKTSMKERHFLFDHPVYNEIKIRIKEQEDFLMNPIEVEDSIIECHRCHSKKTISYAKQTRASDEGTTVFVSCTKCHFHFRL